MNPSESDTTIEPNTEPTADSRLQRWSQRKLAARSATDTPPDATPADLPTVAVERSAPSPLDANANSPKLPNQESRAQDLPDIDSLDENSDYSAFLSPEVEASVRRVALRKLFGLPSFAVRDGLDDYDDDFGSFEGLGDIVTHEMKRLAAQELARQQQDDGELDASLTANPDQAPEHDPEPTPAQTSPPQHLADSDSEHAAAGEQASAITTDSDHAADHSPDHNTGPNSPEPTAHA